MNENNIKPIEVLKQVLNDINRGEINSESGIIIDSVTWHNIKAAIEVEKTIAKQTERLRDILMRLSNQSALMSSTQHSGARLLSEDWSTLYRLTDEAKALLDMELDL